MAEITLQLILPWVDFDKPNPPKLPNWVIPDDIDRTELLNETQSLLSMYLAGTEPSPYICRNCTKYWLTNLLVVVRASLREPSKALEVNMDFDRTCTTIKDLRILWLKELEALLLNQ